MRKWTGRVLSFGIALWSLWAMLGGLYLMLVFPAGAPPHPHRAYWRIDEIKHNRVNGVGYFLGGMVLCLVAIKIWCWAQRAMPATTQLEQ